MWAWRPLFRVRGVFFATFPERSRSRPRQTTGPFRKELKKTQPMSSQLPWFVFPPMLWNFLWTDKNRTDWSLCKTFRWCLAAVRSQSAASPHSAWPCRPFSPTRVSVLLHQSAALVRNGIVCKIPPHCTFTLTTTCQFALHDKH